MIMKKILTLLLFILAGSVGMKAQTTFIGEMCVINVKDKSNVAAVTNEAISKGWSIVKDSNGEYADFSDTARSPSWYIYLGYKTTTDWTKAVKMIGVLHQTTPANSNWTIVPAYNNTSGNGTACTANMNEGKGTPLYLFVKYDNGDASAAVTSLNYVYNGTGSGSVPDYDNSSAPADFLLGTGSSNHIYLKLGYHQHTLKWWADDVSTCHRECSACSYKGPAVKHAFESFAANSDGRTHKTKCSNCGAQPSFAHNYKYTASSTSHQGTCVDCGAKTTAAVHTYSDTYTWKDTDHCAHACTVCGHEEVKEHFPGTWSANSGVTSKHRAYCRYCNSAMFQEHEYAWTTKNDVSCAYLCTVCGHNKNNGYSDHNRVYHDDAVEATCTAYGKTATWHCARCSYEGKSESVKPLGHSYDETHQEIAATCVKEGTIYYRHCSRCLNNLDIYGHILSAEDLVIPIDPKAHQRTLVSEKPSTCTESGYSSHYRCTLCEKYFYSANQTVELSADYIFIPPHVSTSYIQQRIEPTCTVKGLLEHYLCRTCNKRFLRDGKVMTEITDDQKYIPALGHDLKTFPEMATSGGTYAAHEQCRRCYEFICPDDPLRNSNDFSGVLAGSGTEADPYLITSQNDLHVMAVRYDLTRNPPFNARKTQRYFRIARDFTISGTYLPVGFRLSQQVNYGGAAFMSEPYFSDILDGACHTVTFDNVTLDPASAYGGLLGSIDYTLSSYTKKNTVVRNLTVCGSLSAGENTQYIAGICGVANNADVTNCHNYATLHASPTTTTSVAGIIARGSSNPTIIACSNHADLTVVEPQHTNYVALAGITNGVYANVSDCCNTGNLTIVSNNKSTLSGVNCSPNTTNCRNTGNLTFRSTKRTNSSIYGIAEGARNSYNGGNITIDETNTGSYPSSIYAVSKTADAHNFFAGTVSAPLVNNTTLDPEGSYTTVTLTDDGVDDATIGALNTWVGTNSTDTRRYNLWTRGDDGLPVFSCEMGDFNNDGVISVGDMPMLIDILRGVYSTQPLWHGDVNADGHTDLRDLDTLTDCVLQR